jgi:CheY-like chemotaxis protein
MNAHSVLDETHGGATATRAKTIMLVDDDRNDLALYRGCLEERGYAIISARSCEEAVEMLQKRQPDAALVNLWMEQPDAGVTLCHFLKKKKPTLPVIIITAITRGTGLRFDVITAEQRSWLKADAILTKPVRPEQLCGEFERLLGEV